MLMREQFKLPLQYTREKKLFIEEASRVEERRKRQIPYDEPERVSAILKFRQLKDRQLAVQYASERFQQVRTSFMVDGFGPRVHEHLAKLQDSHSKYELSPEEALKTERP